jgi:TonB family protein
MRVATLSSAAPVLASLALVGGCASESQSRREDEEVTQERSSRPYRPGQTPVTLGDEREDDVKVQLERGYLNQNDINEVIERNQAQLIACYERAGQARKYASGQVDLRFMVTRTGTVSEVRVVGSQLGNYAVERCLVVEGRKLRFPPPGGDKAADFDYALDFRASGEVKIVEWSGETLARDVRGLMPTLAGCGPPSDDAVEAVAYVQPGGAVVSVGLASDGRIDIMNAICVVEQIRKWRLPGDGSHVVRTTFPVSTRPRAAQVTRRAAKRRVR